MSWNASWNGRVLRRELERDASDREREQAASYRVASWLIGEASCSCPGCKLRTDGKTTRLHEEEEGVPPTTLREISILRMLGRDPHIVRF
ncbi:hypothetical protein YC2023_084516 [Brassica napus]